MRSIPRDNFFFSFFSHRQVSERPASHAQAYNAMELQFSSALTFLSLSKMFKLFEIMKGADFARPVEVQQDGEGDNILTQLGLRRELERKFSKFTTVSFAMGIMG